MSELRADPTPREQSPDPVALAPVVEDLLRGLGSAVRSYRLYAGNGPMLDRFVEGLRGRLVAAWEQLPSVRLQIDEQAMHWEGQRVYPSGDSGGDLAFLFFKDGIREITLLSGLEDEVDRLLSVLGRAPQVREEEDDLITLLWQEDLRSFKYHYVELGAEVAEPATGTSPPKQVDASSVREAAREPTPGLRPDDFQETLYFLDESELRQLAEEVRREAARDLWRDVLNALYDRLEDGTPERQVRVVRILGDLLPPMLGGGDFGQAAQLLREVADLAGRPGVLGGEALREARQLFAHLAAPATVAELVKTLELAPESLQSDGLAALLGFFPPAAIAPLTRAVATVSRPDVRRTLEGAIQRLAEANREEVLRLLSDSDPAVVAGALRWVGALQIGSAVSELVPLLKHPAALVRLAAVDALAELRAAVAAGSLVPLLEDAEREVRVASARALSTLQHPSARAALGQAVGSKRLRAADRTEKIAFFEALGAVAGAEEVAALDSTLNSKSWLGRGESPEIRACAALGLARARHPAARTALLKAASDPDPVVRSAVTRALREPNA